MDPNNKEALDAWILAMGYDGVERFNLNAPENYLLLGKKVKMYNKVSSNNFEFCSTKWTGSSIGVPCNVDKMLTNFLQKKPQTYGEAMTAKEQLLMELRHYPKLDEIKQLFEDCGWNDQLDGLRTKLMPSADPSEVDDPLYSSVPMYGSRIELESVPTVNTQIPIVSSQVIAQNPSQVLTRKPRDCTELLRNKGVKHAMILVLCLMYSPILSLWYTIQMTKKNKTKTGANANSRVLALEKRLARMAVARKQPKQPKKKATPFADSGRILGGAIGGMFGNSSMGKGIGRFLGSGIGSILGSGDYTVMGNQPKYNVLANGSQIPQFSTTRQTNIVCHREYLGDITGTAGFNNVPYILNPGVATTFPWLSGVANNYQEYRFHGLVFEFRPLITDFVTAGAPGVVVMSTNYNADAVIYTTKQQMENAEYAVSVKPTMALMHGIECATSQTILPEKFIRTGAVPANQDLRLYDAGTFQFATQANPIQDLGELWVSYCVEFFKPIQPIVEFEPSIGFHAVRSTAAAATPFGLISVRTSGSLPVTVTGTAITITSAVPGVNYMMNIFWDNGISATVTFGSSTFTNCNLVQDYNNGTAGEVSAPNSGVISSAANLQLVVTSALLNPGPITFTLGTGTYPASFLDIFVLELDPAIVG
jgi:hypothetical protein